MTVLATLIFTAAACAVAHVICGTLVPAMGRIADILEDGHANQ